VAGYAAPTEIVYLPGHESDTTAPVDPSEIFTIVVEENPLLLLSPALASSHLQTIRTLIRNARCKRVSLERKEPLDLTEIALRFVRLIGD
jgi:hypothetical protein